MQQAIEQFGYLAVFIGTFVEGETILALAGMAAAHGYLSLTAIIGVATVGAFLGDQACFYVGRRYGHRILARFPGLAAKAPRVQALMRRWDAPAVIALRFLYGLRVAGPIVIGTCGISPWRLALFNFIGVLIWAPLVAGIGYLAGYALQEWLARFQQVQLALVLIAAAAAGLAWYFVRRRRRA